MEKLKVWDKESKEIFEVSKINFETKELSYKGNPSGYDVDALFEQVIFLKPSGVPDITGKEIHLDDIIYIDGSVSCKDLPNLPPYYGIVKFIDGCFYLDDMYDDLHLLSDLFNPKIIGNIYENPELLEQGRVVTQES